MTGGGFSQGFFREIVPIGYKEWSVRGDSF